MMYSRLRTPKRKQSIRLVGQRTPGSAADGSPSPSGAAVTDNEGSEVVVGQDETASRRDQPPAAGESSGTDNPKIDETPNLLENRETAKEEEEGKVDSSILQRSLSMLNLQDCHEDDGGCGGSSASAASLPRSMSDVDLREDTKNASFLKVALEAQRTYIEQQELIDAEVWTRFALHV